jgi:hypothetical protein
VTFCCLGFRPFLIQLQINNIGVLKESHDFASGPTPGFSFSSTLCFPSLPTRTPSGFQLILKYTLILSLLCVSRHFRLEHRLVFNWFWSAHWFWSASGDSAQKCAESPHAKSIENQTVTVTSRRPSMLPRSFPSARSVGTGRVRTRKLYLYVDTHIYMHEGVLLICVRERWEVVG